MTGPEHYQEAERLLAEADRDVSANWSTQTGEHKADILAAAQVHATLALVAATVAERVTAPANSPEVLLSDVTDDWSVAR